MTNVSSTPRPLQFQSIIFCSKMCNWMMGWKSVCYLKQDWEEKFGQQQKCASGTSACSSMKMWPVHWWPVVITKQCKSKHCTAWEHISPNVQKECQLIPVNLQNDRAKLTTVPLWNTMEIELYIVPEREFKRRQRSILSKGNTLHWMRILYGDREDTLVPNKLLGFNFEKIHFNFKL